MQDRLCVDSRIEQDRLCVDNFSGSQGYPQSLSLRYETLDDISHQAQIEKHEPGKQNDNSREHL